MQNLKASIDLYQLTEEIGRSLFVGLGSQAEYGPQSGRIHESDPAKPVELYGAAKYATGLILQRTANITNRPFSWLRLFSSYGPNDDPSWLIPYLINCLLVGETPSLTDAEQIWDYLHVDDAAAAIVAVIDSDARGFFNLGSGQARVLREIITMIRDQINPSIPLGFGKLPYRFGQVMHLEADNSALLRATKWLPKVSLEEGLASTIAWHRAKNSLVI